MRRALLLAFVLFAGCRDHRPPQPTAEQSDQLNDAEDMLNSMARNQAAQNREGPEANAPGPSNSSE
jgi:hypothetical protein